MNGDGEIYSLTLHIQIKKKKNCYPHIQQLWKPQNANINLELIKYVK